MQKKLLSGVAVGVFLLCLGTSGSVFASPVNVENHSFEELPVGGLPYNILGTLYSAGPIPGWSNTGSSGQLILNNFEGNPNAIDGDVIAWTNDDSITQNVTSAVANTTYTLIVALLHRTDAEMSGVIRLQIGDTIVEANGLDAGLGTWNDWTATYTTTADDTGKTVIILLGTSGIQGDFDNVRLDAMTAPVPVPSTVLLFGSGLAGIAGLAGKKRRV